MTRTSSPSSSDQPEGFASRPALLPLVVGSRVAAKGFLFKAHTGCHDSRSCADMTCCIPDTTRLVAADLCIKNKLNPAMSLSWSRPPQDLRTQMFFKMNLQQRRRPTEAVKRRGWTAGGQNWFVQQLLHQLGIDCRANEPSLLLQLAAF